MYWLIIDFQDIIQIQQTWREDYMKKVKKRKGKSKKIEKGKKELERGGEKERERERDERSKYLSQQYNFIQLNS